MIVPTFTDFGIIFIIIFDTPVIENIHNNTPSDDIKSDSSSVSNSCSTCYKC